MRYSSFNWKSGIWAANPRRGWIFGPFFGRTLTLMLDRRTTPSANTYNINTGDVEEAFAQIRRQGTP